MTFCTHPLRQTAFSHQISHNCLLIATISIIAIIVAPVLLISPAIIIAQ